MIESLKKLFWISRPVSWPNTAFPFAAGYIVAGGQVDMMFVVATLYFLGPYNLLMYGVNDIFDYESDIRNPRKGGIEGMREQRAFHPTILRAAIISNVPFLTYLLAVGNDLSRIILVGLIFFVIAYSIVGLRFKEKPLLDSMTSSIHFVGPLIFALSLTNFPMSAWPYVIAFFLWGMASHAFGAVQDIIPDRQAGLASIATFLGARATVWFSLLLYTAASVIIAFQGKAVFAVAAVGLVYVANCAPYVHISDADSGQTNRAWRRFIWFNMFAGFVVAITLISRYI